MKIKILSSANQDLIDGYWFYEKQSEGVGEYFMDTLFSDIDSLMINAGIHPIYFEKYQAIWLIVLLLDVPIVLHISNLEK